MEEVRAQLANYYEQQLKMLEDNKVREEKDRALSRAANQHHLIGTQKLPGVYKGKKEENLCVNNTGFNSWIRRHTRVLGQTGYPGKSLI